MNNIKLKAWAQNLDTKGPDTFFASGEGEISEGSPRRQKIVQDMSAVAYDGDLLDSLEDVEVFYSESAFVVEVTVEERDVRGRLATVSVYGQWPNVPDVEWGQRVSSEIQTICDTIDRTPPQTLARLPKLLVEAATKKKGSQILKVITALAGISLLSLVAYLLYKNFLGG